MTSIFSTDYQQLLKRIESKHTSPNQGAEQANSKPEPFARILADIEKNANNPSETKALAKAAAEPEMTAPVLTNLQAEEPVYSRARLADYANSTATSDSQSVKEEAGSVKGLPPSPLLPTPAAAPEVPQIISARIVQTAESVKTVAQGPATPLDGIKDIVTTAGKFHGVDPSLTLAVAQAESSFRPDAVSTDGHESKGVFQLLDSTAKEMMEFSKTNEEYDPFDAGMNSFLGVGYLRRLLDMFSEPTSLSSRTSTIPAKDAGELEKFAVAAFNAGQGRVARAQAQALSMGRDPSVFSSVESLLPTSTQEYVARVQDKRVDFAKEIDLEWKV